MSKKSEAERFAYQGAAAGAIGALVTMIATGVDAITMLVSGCVTMVAVVAIATLVTARRRGRLTERTMWLSIALVTLVIIAGLWVAGGLRES